MADAKISALTEATTLDGTEEMVVVQTSTKRVGVDTLFSAANDMWEGWVFPSDAAWVGSAGEPLTSTSWDGDGYSTAAKTKIDLSAVFSAPAGIRAINARIACRDSDSASTNNLFALLSPNATAGSTPLIARPSGLPNDYYAEANGICPCDGSGDVYYQLAASGTGTLDVVIQIWGYLLT